MFFSIKTVAHLFVLPLCLISCTLAAQEDMLNGNPTAVRYDAQATALTTQQIMRGKSFKATLSHKRDKQKVSGEFFTVKDHFLGAEKQETSQINTDTTGAIGTKQYLVAIKGRVRTFDKETKRPDGVLDTTLDDFFRPVSMGNLISDPRLIFDQHSKRWIMIAISGGSGFANEEENNEELFQARNTLVKNVPAKAQLDATFPVNLPVSVIDNHGFFLAVSNDDVITADTVWYFYTIDAQKGRAAVSFFDFDTLGVDEQAIYIATDVIIGGFTASFNSSFYVIQKASVVNGGPAHVSAFYNLTSQFGMVVIQPATNFDSGTNAGYALSQDITNSTRMLLSTVLNPGSLTPQLTAPIPIDVPEYNNTIPSPALGSIKPIGTLFANSSAPHIRNNKLWQIYDRGMDASGQTPVNPADIDRVGSTYIVLDLANPSVVIQSGTLFDPSPVAPRSYYYSSIMTNKDGKVLIGSSVSSENERINAAVSLLLDNASTFETLLYTNSTTDFNPTDDTRLGDVWRWGDYSLVTVDPKDPQKFWAIEEYCYNTDTWGVEIAEVAVK